jgi:hypothetical protein
VRNNRVAGIWDEIGMYGVTRMKGVCVLLCYRIYEYVRGGTNIRVFF